MAIRLKRGDTAIYITPRRKRKGQPILVIEKGVEKRVGWIDDEESSKLFAKALDKIFHISKLRRKESRLSGGEYGIQSNEGGSQ